MSQVITRTETLKNGDTIIEEGTWAHYAYILLEGKAKVWKMVNQKKVMVGTLKEGDIFGEMCFFGMLKRTATVTADGEVKVGIIEKDTLLRAIDMLPEETREKLDEMCRDLFYINDAYCHLANCLHEILNIKGKKIDQGVFEKEIEMLPEDLRKIVVTMGQRFNTALERCKKLMMQLEDATKPINSLSTSLFRD